jgi:hypothetical protein
MLDSELIEWVWVGLGVWKIGLWGIDNEFVLVWEYLESFGFGASKRAFNLNIVQVFGVIKLGLVQVWIWHDMGSFLGLWIGSELVRLLHQ